MSEEITINPAERKITVSFNRKISDGNFGTVEMGVFVQDEVPIDATDPDVSELAVSLSNVAKAAVFQALGLEAVVDGSGVMREKHRVVANPEKRLGDEFGATNAAPPAASAPAGGFNTRGLKVMNPKEMKEDIPQALADKCNELGITAVWANYSDNQGTYYKEAVPKGEESIVGGNRVIQFQ